MRWGGRKSAHASSSRPSFISHVSPLSWLSKFKLMRINSQPIDGKLKQKGNPDSLSVSSSRYACGGVHSGDDGGFRRLQFGEESHEREKSKDILKTEFYNRDKKQGRKEGTLKFKEKEIGKEERKFPKDSKTSLQNDEYNREKELEKLRRTFERKAQRIMQERILKSEKVVDKAESAAPTKSVEKDVLLQIESPRTICTPRTHSFVASGASKNSSLRSIKIDRPSGKKKHLAKSEMKARKPKQGSKVRIYSPRMASKVEICKIKALEDMKKAKLKMKKAEERMLEETAGLDSFAVVKCSSNPEKDFRDSMVEMVTELQINQPEEMEELLACYLTLNSDEYHDLIVKVFRQVWLDINKDILGIT